MADVFPNLKMAKGATSVATAGTVFGFNLAPRVTPQKGQERITDTDRMVATALSPGFKAIICPE